MSFEVRHARPDDVYSIVTWTTDTFEWGDYVPERLPAWIEAPESHVVVSVDPSDRPIGVSHTLMLSPTEAWLEAARVHPDHRRSGLGKAMNHAGTSWARDQGARIARLATEVTNTAARHQVEAISYRHTSTWGYAEVPPGQDPLAEGVAMRPAPTADVDAAWLAWNASDLSREGKELIATGWRWRKATPEDLVRAIADGELFQSSAGWAIVRQPREEILRCDWMTTTPEDAPLLLDGLRDLGRSRGISEIKAMFPWVPWMRETMVRAGADITEVAIYSRAL